MTKLLLAAAGAGIVSAILSISVASGSLIGLPLAYLAPLPLFAVGLSLGWRAAFVAAISGSVVLGTLVNPGMGAVYFLGTGLAPIVLCRLALMWREDAAGQRTWYPPGRLLVWLSGTTAAFFVASLVYFSGEDGGLVGTLERHLMATADLLEHGDPNGQVFSATAEAIRQSAPNGARVLPGTLALSWMLSVMLNGILAQAIVRRSERNFRPTPNYGDLELPRSLSYVVAGALALSFLPGSLGFAAGTLAAIAIWPYFIMGLVVIHVISRRLTARFMVLAAFYLFLVGLGWPAAVVAGIGIMDQWTELRRRYGVPPGGQEKE